MLSCQIARKRKLRSDVLVNEVNALLREGRIAAVVGVDCADIEELILQNYPKRIGVFHMAQGERNVAAFIIQIVNVERVEFGMRVGFVGRSKRAHGEHFREVSRD